MKKAALLSFALLLLFASNAWAGGAPRLVTTSSIVGSKLRIFANNVGELGAKPVGNDSNFFYSPSGDTGIAGLALFIQSPDEYVSYGPGQTRPYTPVDIPSVSGLGTAESPYQMVVHYAVDSDSPDPSRYFDIEQTITHVSGTMSAKVDYAITSNIDYGGSFEAYQVGLTNLSKGTISYSGEIPRFVAASSSDGRLVVVEESQDSPYSFYAAYGAADPLQNEVAIGYPTAGKPYTLLSPTTPSGVVDYPAIGAQWSNWGIDYGTPVSWGNTALVSTIWRFAAPVQGSTATGGVESGTVLVKKPGTDEYIPLQDGGEIPVGSTVDTRSGAVRLVTAAGKKTQSATFKEGLFVFRQSKGSPLVRLSLAGANVCGRSTDRKKKGKSLWGKGKGKYRTSGSKGSGSVRGTTWRVTDLCNGNTLIEDIQGSVLARDSKTGQKKLLRTGQSFLADGKK